MWLLQIILKKKFLFSSVSYLSNTKTEHILRDSNLTYSVARLIFPGFQNVIKYCIQENPLSAYYMEKTYCISSKHHYPWFSRSLLNNYDFETHFSDNLCFCFLLHNFAFSELTFAILYRHLSSTVANIWVTFLFVANSAFGMSEFQAVVFQVPQLILWLLFLPLL